MVDYLYSTKNYEKLLLVDINTSIDFIPEYITGLNYPGFTRYSVAKRKGYYTENTDLYKILYGYNVTIGEVFNNGNLEIVKHLHKKGQTISEYNIDIAAMNGHLEVIKYLMSDVTEERLKTDGINWAVGNGHLELVRYLFSRDISKITENSVSWSIVNGHIKVVKYLYLVHGFDNSLKVTNDGMKKATTRSNLEIVKYLQEAYIL